MKNHHLIKAFFLFTSFSLLLSFFDLNAFSQNHPINQGSISIKDTITTPHLICSQKTSWENAIAKNPNLKTRHQKWEDQMLIQAAKNSFAKPISQFDLPIVVHIIHDNGTENITDAQVEQGIADLNAAFSNQDYYAQTFGVNTDIQFCLATQDPNGNFTTGINRVVSPLTEMILETEDLDVKNLIRWDPNNYINIWLVRQICEVSGDCGTAGYAYFPSAHGSDIDGIVEEAKWFGSNPANSSVTVHEMGHYLGLYHTFEGGCQNDNCLSNGDRVCDTPPDQTIVPGPCNSSINSCTSDVNSADPNNPFTVDQNDNSSNFMDYGFFQCLTNFTAGQTVRMQDAIVNSRSSLLDSPGCSSACPTPIIANFETSSDTIELGGSVNFINNSSGGLYFDWTVDQVSFNGISYTFNTAGTFEVTLVLTNDDPNCVASFSQNITVICGAQAVLEVDVLQVGINDPVNFVDNSTNANSTFWTVEGTQESTDPNFQFSSSVVGFYNICLVAENGICQTDTCVIISVLGNSSNNEICDNGLDDDGDGLIDCYDPDCCETANCINNSFLPCEEEGCDPPTYNDFEMQLKWNTSTAPFNMSPLGRQPSGGNLAGNGIVGLLEGRRPARTVRLVDGSDGSIIWSIGNVETGGPLIADVDLDGTAEIFLISEEIVRLEHDGTFTGSTVFPYANFGGWFSAKYTMADFNQDGIPEIFALGHLVNTQNLEILSSVPLDIFPFFFQYGVGVPVDVLPASPTCPDCDGLELVVGPFLFSVHPTTFEFTLIHGVVEFAPFYTQSNTTSIADMDNDGDLDCVVYGVGDPSLYIWDIQTPTFIAKAEQSNFPFIIGSHNYPAIADLDDDGFPEVICRSGNSIVAFNHDLASHDWTAPITEFGGNATQVIFDVNGDGLEEVIYRDNALLRIINGQTGEELSSIPCQSGTSSESPSILDVDGDGQAEIACECMNRTHVFEAAGDKPWANARNFYDQFPTFHVQRNDDLTVPKVLQKQQLVGDGNVFNSFLQVYSIPFDPIDCDEICDNGIDDDNDGLIDCEDDDCCLDASCTNQPTPCDTCLFVGNINLGPDQEVCDNGIINFNAGSGFDSYLWSDQSSDSTFTAVGAGTIWVVAIDSCGTTYTDSVTISNIITTEVNLGSDISLCPGDSAQLSGGIFDNYEWFKDDILVCQGCPDIMVDDSDEGEYILLGSSNLGCFSIDTINVGILENFQTQETLQICEGDSIEVFGQIISQDSVLSQNFITNNGCDSLHTISVEVLPNFQTQETLQICEGDSIEVFGQIVAQDSVLNQSFAAANGCDSLHTVSVEVLPSFQTQETLQICEGTSIEVFGQIVAQDSILSQNFAAANGCDSIHTITVELIQVFQSNENIQICEGDSIEIFGQIISQNSTLSQTVLATNGCDSLLSVSVEIIPNFQTNETFQICEGTSIEVFGQNISQDSVLSQNFIAVNGCDSIHTVSVEVLMNFQSNENIQFCEGDSVEVFGQIISQDSILSQSFIAANGCDSLHTISVEVLPNFQTQETLQICEGTSIEVFGQIVAQDSILSQNFIANNGCDSTHTVTVELTQVFQSNENIQICEGDSIEVFGQIISQDSTLSQTVLATNGCDSLLSVSVEIIPNFQTNEAFQICEGTSIEVFGQNISQDSVLSQNFIAANGCDSIHTVSVEVLMNFQSNENIQICEGDSVEVFGQVISQDSILSQNFIASNECDSLHTISVEVLGNFQNEEDIFGCNGDAINILGQDFFQDTIVIETLFSTNGCDSINQFNLFFQDEIIISDSIILCGNEFILFFGDTITTSGFYEFIQNPLTGLCDTTFQLAVESYTVPVPDLEITIPCPGENFGALEIINPQSNWMYSLDGTNYQASPFFENLPSGNYEFWIEDDFGCTNQLIFEVQQQALIDIQMPASFNQNIGDTLLIPVSYSDTTNLIFSWSPSENLSCDNCPFPSVALQSSQSYTLTILDSIGCEQTANIEVIVNDIPNVYIPNAFTPNGDTFNDRFTIYGNSLIAEVTYLRIFDRWGELVFEAQNFAPNDEAKGWNGLLKGEAVLQGVYVYTCEVKTTRNQRLEFSGDLTLVR